MHIVARSQFPRFTLSYSGQYRLLRLLRVSTGEFAIISVLHRYTVSPGTPVAFTHLLRYSRRTYLAPSTSLVLRPVLDLRFPALAGLKTRGGESPQLIFLKTKNVL